MDRRRNAQEGKSLVLNFPMPSTEPKYRIVTIELLVKEDQINRSVFRMEIDYKVASKDRIFTAFRYARQEMATYATTVGAFVELYWAHSINPIAYGSIRDELTVTKAIAVLGKEFRSVHLAEQDKLKVSTKWEELRAYAQYRRTIQWIKDSLQ